MDVEAIQKTLDTGVTQKVFSGCALEVGFEGEKTLSLSAGGCSYDPEDHRVSRHTLFDLGSLTKPLATALALMSLHDEGLLELDRPVGEILPPGVPRDKAAVTPRLLLTHTAGFTDWAPYYKRLEGVAPLERKTTLRRWLVEEPLRYEPGTECLYSDPGFILLEWVVERLAGEDMAGFVEDRFYRPLNLSRLFLFQRGRAPGFQKEDFAATEDCPWRKRVLRGEVHDENAFALGGYSGHAGLFGTAGDVYELLQLLRGHLFGLRRDFFRPETLWAFFEKQEQIPGCGRALGWDMPAGKGSAAGRYFSRKSVGHLGFPGTSLWMDLEKDVQVVFLSNRVHPSRANTAIRDFRPRIHDLVMKELGFGD